MTELILSEKYAHSSILSELAGKGVIFAKLNYVIL